MNDSVISFTEFALNLGTARLVSLSGSMVKLNKRPIQHLPIPHPSDYEPEDPLFFYDNIVHPLIYDFIRLESVGIPISLDKVAELEKTVTTVLEDVKEKLSKNPIMLEFLKHEASLSKKDKAKELTLKKKSYEDFVKPFDIKNKIHRSYVVNQWLTKMNHNDMLLEEWTIKDLKTANQILAAPFLQSLIDKTADITAPIFDYCMKLLAEDKAKAWNKNVDEKVDTLDDEKFFQEFNAGSSLQKQKFFEFVGIDSDAETKGGAPQFDRKQLERIQHILKDMIEEEENAGN